MSSDVSLSGSISQLLSGSVQISGLGSGTDFGAVVDQLVALEGIRVQSLETWKASWEAKITSLQGLNSRMISLKDYCSQFDSFDEFYSRTSSSTNGNVVSVSNTSSATPGSHTIQVGSDIQGRVATRSYQDGLAVGGDAGEFLYIRLGDPDDAGTWQTIQLQEGVDWDAATDDIDALAAAIDAVDDAGADLLEAVQVVNDKDRDGNTYKRLILTAKEGGTAMQLWAEQPAGMDLFYQDAAQRTSIDDPYYEANWNNTGGVDLASSGTYLGGTNKTFTFMINTTGKIGQDDIRVTWADNEGNSGSFIVDDFDTYEVFQGVQVQFLDTTPGDDSDDIVFAADSFTLDAYHSTFQAGQDTGLAQVEQRVHSGFSDLTTAVTTAAATFSYTYEGVETTLDVAAGTRLQSLAALINNDSNNRGVRASIVNDGTSSSTAYHLVLTGRQTGAEHTITGISGTLDNFDTNDAAFETTQRATDAMLKVDGFPSASWEYLQRSSNSISDVLGGITLNLRGAGTAVVTVADNQAAMKANIETFVNSLNFLMDYIRDETKYIPETGEKGVMIGNYTYSMVWSTISDKLTPTGLIGGEDAYTALAQIGIKTDDVQLSDGRWVRKWVVDESLLDQALSADPEAVARLFVEDTENGSLGVCSLLNDELDHLSDSETGPANVIIDNYNGIIKGIDDKIQYEAKRLTLYEERLKERFARLESTLGELNGQLSYLESQVDQLPKIGGSK